MTAPEIGRPYQMLPPLDADQRFILRQSIEKCGVLEPVVFDEDGDILDGHHRVEIAEELGIEYPRRVITDLDEPEKWMYAVTVNVARRHLDQSSRTGLIAQMRIRGMSIRDIAKRTGLSRGTVANDIAQLSKSGQLAQPERITGADGKDRPATRPTPTPGPSDAELSPSVDPGAAPAPAEASPDPAPREPGPTPEPAGPHPAGSGPETPEPVVTSTAHPGSGQGEEAAPVREGPGAAAEPEPTPAAPSLRLDPTDDEKRAAVQRDARRLLLRAVEILAPAHDRPGFAETWARQLGPYDDELSDLIRRATEAIATLDHLIEGCGQ